MARITVLAILCLGFFITAVKPMPGDDGEGLLGGLLGDGDGPLSDKPLLKLLLLRGLLGQSGQPAGSQLPLARAMMSQNAQMPILRAMMMRNVAQNGGPPILPALMMARNQESQAPLLRALVLFRMMGERMGKRILEEIENRVEDNTIYNFGSVMICDCAMEYHEDGEMKGFTIDLINEVCKEAGKKCTIQYTPSSKCYANSGDHSSAGEALLGRQVDACSTWLKSTERGNSVAFTEGYWRIDTKTRLYTVEGNPNGIKNDVTGLKIGMVTGWVSDDVCMRGNEDQFPGASTLKKSDIVRYDSPADMVIGLQNKEVDAVFAFEYGVQELAKKGLILDAVSEAVNCAIGDSLHFITRKDSTLLPWFNTTLKEMKENGKYYRLCREAKIKHGKKGRIQCML